MDKGVEGGGEVAVATRSVVDDDPPDREDRRVVVPVPSRLASVTMKKDDDRPTARGHRTDTSPKDAEQHFAYRCRKEIWWKFFLSAMMNCTADTVGSTGQWA